MNYIGPEAIIDLGKYKNNLLSIQDYVGVHTKVMAVVKANAYGHGAVYIAKAALQVGINHFAVATLYEAMELVNAGIDGIILILGHLTSDELKIAGEKHLRVTISSMETFEMIQELGIKISTHIKVDTGLSRYGFYLHRLNDIPNLIESCTRMIHSKFAIVEGIYTHFSTSDSDYEFTMDQFNIFSEFKKQIHSLGETSIMFHCANSAATIKYKQTHLDMVRVGLSSFGILPFEDMPPGIDLTLNPVLSLKSSITQIKNLLQDDFVGYGRTYKTKHKVKIAILNIGYADGINRLLSNHGLVLVNGKIAKIIGRVSMDVCTIDVTDIDVSLYDEAYFVSPNKTDVLSVKHMASLINTIEYEVLCNLGTRIKRTYISG